MAIYKYATKNKKKANSFLPLFSKNICSNAITSPIPATLMTSCNVTARLLPLVHNICDHKKNYANLHSVLRYMIDLPNPKFRKHTGRNPSIYTKTLNKKLH